MTFEAGKVTMQARGAETGSSEVELPLEDYAGPEVKIAFDPQYLIEFLRAVEGEPTVTLEMSDGTKPALLRCGDGYLYLVMPLAGRCPVGRRESSRPDAGAPPARRVQHTRPAR